MMPPKKEDVCVLTVGCSFAHSQIRQIAFDGPDTLLDSDITLLDLKAFSDELSERAKNAPYGNLSNADYFILVNLLTRRSQEIGDFLREGRVLVLFARELPLVPYYSGSPRTGTQHLNLHSHFHWGEDAFKSASGVNIAWLLTSPYVEFCRAVGQQLHYRALIRNGLGDRIGTVHRTWQGSREKVIAAHERRLGGHCLYLPPPDDATTEDDQQAFVDALINLALALPSEPVPNGLPTWHRNFLIPGEASIVNRLKKLVDRRTKLDGEIASLQETLKNIENLKWLFAGRDTVLEEIVARVFRELGLYVEKGPKGGTDLIVKFGDHVAVVEVKGKDRKSAAREDGRQLGNWVEEYFDEFGVEPKGILVVNAFGEMQLKDRNDAVFPHDTIAYCKRQEFCVLSGVQLLCLYLDCRDDEKNRQNSLNLLFTHIGVYPKYQGEDWRKFLELAD